MSSSENEQSDASRLRRSKRTRKTTANEVVQTVQEDVEEVEDESDDQKYHAKEIVESRLGDDGQAQFKLVWKDSTGDEVHTWETHIDFQENGYWKSLVRRFEKKSLPKGRNKRVSQRKRDASKNANNGDEEQDPIYEVSDVESDLEELDDGIEADSEEDFDQSPEESPRRNTRSRKLKRKPPERKPRKPKKVKLDKVSGEKMRISTFSSDDETDYSDHNDNDVVHKSLIAKKEKEQQSTEAQSSPNGDSGTHDDVAVESDANFSQWAGLFQEVAVKEEKTDTASDKNDLHKWLEDRNKKKQTKRKPAKVPKSTQKKPMIESSPAKTKSKPKAPGIQFNLTLPSSELCTLETRFSLYKPHQFVVNLNKSSLAGKFAAQSVRRFFLNPNAGYMTSEFKVVSPSRDAKRELRALSHSITGLVCKPEERENGKSTSERLFLFPFRQGEDIFVKGVIGRWDDVERGAKQKFSQCIQMRKLHLVLDLDQTLIYARDWNSDDDESKLGNQKFRIKTATYDMVIQYRPLVGKFLQDMCRMFDLCIYTAADLAYAKDIVNKANRNGWGAEYPPQTNREKIYEFWSKILPPSRIVSSAVEGSNHANSKDLRNSHLFFQWSTMQNTVRIVDDNPSSWILEHQQLVYPISEFRGNDFDTHLIECGQHLTMFWTGFFKQGQ